MVSISPNDFPAIRLASPRAQRVSKVRKIERRWSGLQTVAFAVSVSVLGWVAIGYAVLAVIHH
ncbi:hypothetical protein [Caulobacter sp. S45]|jgi:hypothetical protein|uniref:hypothetical protein n=1 Tax=Caulobacter sp. S45 TaxID=1641861 RepID=UPI00131BA4FA|nr:hypothetical protein [Caulobacter sp. S45]